MVRTSRPKNVCGLREDVVGEGISRMVEAAIAAFAMWTTVVPEGGASGRGLCNAKNERHDRLQKRLKDWRFSGQVMPFARVRVLLSSLATLGHTCQSETEGSWGTPLQSLQAILG